MRTTLTIDDDVLLAARAIARRRRISLGEAVSDLARRTLGGLEAPPERNGIPLLRPPNSTVLTLDMVNALRVG